MHLYLQVSNQSELCALFPKAALNSIYYYVYLVAAAVVYIIIRVHNLRAK